MAETSPRWNYRTEKTIPDPTEWWKSSLEVKLILNAGRFPNLSCFVALQDTNLGKMDHLPDASRKLRDYGSMQAGKTKGTRDELQGPQLEFLVWRLLEVTQAY